MYDKTFIFTYYIQQMMYSINTFYILFVNLENNNKNTQFALQIHANVS